MKLTLIFEDLFDGRLVFKPVIIPKSACNITQEDISREIKEFTRTYTQLVKYKGCIEGVARKFEPPEEFKL